MFNTSKEFSETRRIISFVERHMEDYYVREYRRRRESDENNK